MSVGPGYDYAVIIVLVRTDEGLTGIGEPGLAGRGRGVLGILDHFGELLVGLDPARSSTAGGNWSAAPSGRRVRRGRRRGRDRYGALGY